MGQVETKVDVLAVMDECIKSQNDALANWSHEYLHEARAAVAELIEAASGMLPRDSTYDDDDEARLRAALARVSGGEA